MLNVSTRFPSQRPQNSHPSIETGRTVKALRISLVAAAVLLPLGNICLAQETLQPVPARREFESRTELEAQAKQAEAQHRTGEAWLLKQRLEKGDFQDGDRILFKIQGNTSLPAGFLQIPETLAVRAGNKVELPRMADLSLQGVLRSELNEKLTEHIAQYVKEPNIRSVPLVRLAILGQVGHPGYLYTLADAPLSDVLMQAGGPSGSADMNAVTILRGSDVIWNAQDTQAAFADGLSVDRLHLRAGDEVMVPEQHHFPWWEVFTVGVSTTALLVGLLRR
jgi:protein involved in polysaccharide export with SLBB domain